MKENSLVLLNAMAQIIYDKKGLNILAVNVHGLSSMTDYLLIAEGNVDRHVSAMAHAIVAILGERGMYPIQSEGIKTGDWVVLDYGEVMVHLFMPGLREKYSLERLWSDSKIVDLEIDASQAWQADNPIHNPMLQYCDREGRVFFFKDK